MRTIKQPPRILMMPHSPPGGRHAQEQQEQQQADYAGQGARVGQAGPWTVLPGAVGLQLVTAALHANLRRADNNMTVMLLRRSPETCTVCSPSDRGYFCQSGMDPGSPQDVTISRGSESRTLILMIITQGQIHLTASPISLSRAREWGSELRAREGGGVAE